MFVYELSGCEFKSLCVSIYFFTYDPVLSRKKKSHFSGKIKKVYKIKKSLPELKLNGNVGIDKTSFQQS